MRSYPMLVLVLAAAVTVVAPAPLTAPKADNPAAGLTCDDVLALAPPGSQGSDRLIATGPRSCGWRSPDAVAALIRTRWSNTSGPGHTHPGPGFVDQSWKAGGLAKTAGDAASTLMRQRQRQRQRQRRQAAPVYPERPAHPVLVRSTILSASEAGLFRTLAGLTSFHNRFYEGPHGIAAAEWIRDQVQAIIDAEGGGDRGITVRLVQNDGFPQPNVVARIDGYDRGPDAVILGAHFDSINSVGPRDGWAEARAPGADDDGSGSAVVLEAFRAVVATGILPARSLEFHWYAGEELGLLGSQQLAKAYHDEGKEVHAMLEIDMCGGGWAAGSTGGFRFITDLTYPPLTRFEQQLVDEYCEYGWEEGECGYGCSDHASWTEYGFPSSFPIERSGTSDPITGEPCPGHTDDDRLVCVSLGHMFDYTRLAIAFLIELSFTITAV